jgi:hypothetical protein
LLVLTTSGAANDIVARYPSDGYAALLALERAINVGTSGANISNVKKSVTNFVLKPGDPTAQLRAFDANCRDLMRGLPNITEANCVMDLFNGVPVQYDSLKRWTYNSLDHALSEVQSYWQSYLQNERREIAAGINDGGDIGGGFSGGGGGGGGGGGSGGKRFSGECFACGRKGHRAEDCQSRDKGKPRPNPKAAAAAVDTTSAPNQADLQATIAAGQRAQEQLAAISAKEQLAAITETAAALSFAPAGRIPKATSGAVVDFNSYGDATCAFEVIPSLKAIPAPSKPWTSSYDQSSMVALGFVIIFIAITLIAIGGGILYTVYANGPADTVSTVGTNSVSTALAAITGFFSKMFKLNSGATVHICNNASWFIPGTLDYHNNPSAANVSSERVTATAVGHVQFSVTSTEGLVEVIILKDVWLMPEVPFNLISVSKMEDAGMMVDFEHRVVKFNRQRMVAGFQGRFLSEVHRNRSWRAGSPTTDECRVAAIW